MPGLEANGQVDGVTVLTLEDGSHHQEQRQGEAHGQSGEERPPAMAPQVAKGQFQHLDHGRPQAWCSASAGSRRAASSAGMTAARAAMIATVSPRPSSRLTPQLGYTLSVMSAV